MAEGSGGGVTGLMGVVIGAILVIGIGYFFIAGGGFGGKSNKIDVEIAVPKVAPKSG